MGFTDPPPRDGILHLTEGGFETELMFLHGFDLPCFAAFTLLDTPEGTAALDGLYRRACDAAAEAGCAPMIGWLNYRASPDWGARLGLSPEGLREATLRSIDFLDGIRKDYEGQVPDFLVTDDLGPRGDAYGTGGEITEAEAEDYHSVQLETLKGSAVDVVTAATFNNVPEAIGAARAAQALDIPLPIYWSLNAESRLASGPTLQEAVEAVDAAVPGAVPWHATNCSHPVEFEPALTDGPWLKRLRAVRPNAAAMDKIALCKLGHLEDGDPVELGDRIGDLARRLPHMDVFGGCCGTDHRHLAEIARGVKAARAAA
ncbi:MAG TPA: homocysteine S-methyltransferase family protein [Paracoccaceae bacterium]|nr:homocysteine S-methyltransferase family protein [Paracoccaceae bacterium]